MTEQIKAQVASNSSDDSFGERYAHVIEAAFTVTYAILAFGLIIGCTLGSLGVL